MKSLPHKTFAAEITARILICLIFIATIAFASCSHEVRPLDYGKDVCEHCKMTLTDKKFGAELVNSKGREYPFDAAECLMKFLAQEKYDTKQAEQIYVVDFANPGKLIDARKSFYLISPAVQSPMGAGIAAFDSRKGAEDAAGKMQGEITDWNGLKNKFGLKDLN